jgi:hypothetical protein
MAYYQSPIAFQLQSFTNQGVILSGGLLHTYIAGTTTLQNTYTDSTATVLNANPLVLDSYGRLTTSIWVIGGVSLKIILKDSSGNTLATVDNIAGINDISLALASPGTIGGTTPGAATFTTLTANTSLTATTANITTLSSTTVSGNISVTGNSTLGDSATADTVTINAYVGMGRSASTNYRCIITGEDSGSTKYALGVYDTGSTNELFRIANDGTFRVGNSSANGPYNNTTSTASANLYISSSGVFQRSTSSIRYKKDVSDLSYSLSDVLKLRPVRYRGINDGDTWIGGLIAEEVDAAGLSEFVAYDTAGRPDALHYAHMVALLINAIKEQNGTIEALKTRVETLENAGNAPAAV